MKEYTRTISRALSFLLAGCILRSSLCMPVSANLNTTIQEEAAPQKVEKQSAESDFEQPYFSGGKSMNAVVVESMNNLTYPASPQTGYWQLRHEAKKIVDVAADYGMDTLFYPVTPELTTMYPSRYLPQSRYLVEQTGQSSIKNPLKSLVKQATEEGMDVCAVISPFEMGSTDYNSSQKTLAALHPELTLQTQGSVVLDLNQEEAQKLIGNIARELTIDYRIGGIALDLRSCIRDGRIQLDSIRSTVDSVVQQVRKQSSILRIGLILPAEMAQGNSLQTEFLRQLMHDGTVNFLLVDSRQKVGDGSYTDTIRLWKEMLKTQGEQMELFAWQDASRIYSPLSEPAFYSDQEELIFRAFSNQIDQLNGSVIDSLRSIQLSPSLSDALSTRQNTSGWYLDTALQQPDSLTIGNPEELSYSSEDSYLITGWCDPTIPLLLNDQNYDGRYGEISDDGYFALQVPLKMGSNRYVFSQNARTRSVSIIRSADASAENTLSPISEIIPESAYPANNEPVSILNPVILSCMAPSGAQVSAELNGHLYTLTQQDPSIRPGYPALFSASAQLFEAETLQISRLGPVSYSMVYNGQLRLQTSLGELVQIGSQQDLAIQTTDPLTAVFADPSEKKLLYALPQGTKDYVTSSTDEYYYLYSGGCIRKKAARILTNKTDIYTLSKKISNVVIQSTSRGEYITFVGGKGLPCTVSYDADERTVSLRLSHVTNMNRQLDYLSSDIFSDIEVQQQENDILVTLPLKEGMPFYGYQVTFNGENIVVYFRSHLSSDAKQTQQPLKGLNIVIDAGHGGQDIGSDSLLGNQSTDEEQLNLLMARALYDRLRILGANVFLTRSGHETMAGLDRIMFAQYREADLFLSFHHCADDPGISIQYNDSFSKNFAEQISAALSVRLDVPQNPVTLANTYSQGVSFCPSLTIQTGNLLDPSDYSRLVKPVNIYRTAYQMGQTLEEFVRSTNEQYAKALSIQQEVASKENEDNFSSNSVIKKGTL